MLNRSLEIVIRYLYASTVYSILSLAWYEVQVFI